MLVAWSLVHSLAQLIAGGKLKQDKQSAHQMATAVTRLLTTGLQTVFKKGVNPTLMKPAAK